MKKLLVLGAVFTMNVFGAERVLINDSKTMEAELNATTVRCSMIGYGARELKISLKGLDGWTLFNHSNIALGDFGGPCMTAGMCKFNSSAKKGFEISDIIGSGDRIETVVVKRQIVEVKDIIKDESGAEFCSRHIEERLATSVARSDGKSKIVFRHLRSGLSELLPLSVCQ